jgi:hypothetical protein
LFGVCFQPPEKGRGEDEMELFELHIVCPSGDYARGYSLVFETNDARLMSDSIEFELRDRKALMLEGTHRDDTEAVEQQLVHQALETFQAAAIEDPDDVLKLTHFGASAGARKGAPQYSTTGAPRITLSVRKTGLFVFTVPDDDKVDLETDGNALTSWSWMAITGFKAKPGAFIETDEDRAGQRQKLVDGFEVKVKGKATMMFAVSNALSCSDECARQRNVARETLRTARAAEKAVMDEEDRADEEDRDAARSARLNAKANESVGDKTARRAQGFSGRGGKLKQEEVDPEVQAALDQVNQAQHRVYLAADLP